MTIDGKRVPVHHGVTPKGDEASEVADFVIHTAGNQACVGIKPGQKVRHDCEDIFRTNRCDLASR